MALSFRNDWCRSFRKDWWFIISKCDADLTQIYRSAPYRFDMIFKQIYGRLLADLSQAKLSFWNDARTVSSKWWIDRLFEITMVFSSKWWMDCHFEMMMTFSSKDWWLSLWYEDDALREMGLDALCCFRNDSHLSCHRRKMLCPVVFTFERIDYFEERPYIFGNDSWFQTDSLPPKTLEILSFSKDR